MMLPKTILLICSVLYSFAHDFHVGICELKYNQKAALIEVTHKIFTDDLEKAIEKQSGKRLLLGNPKQTPDAKQLIGKYISLHFSIKSNGKLIPLNYLGYEIDNDQLFIYLEAKVTTKPKNLELFNNSLIEVFADQSNIIHLDFPGQKKSLYFNENQLSHSVQF